MLRSPAAEQADSKGPLRCACGWHCVTSSLLAFAAAGSWGWFHRLPPQGLRLTTQDQAKTHLWLAQGDQQLAGVRRRRQLGVVHEAALPEPYGRAILPLRQRLGHPAHPSVCECFKLASWARVLSEPRSSCKARQGSHEATFEGSPVANTAVWQLRHSSVVSCQGNPGTARTQGSLLGDTAST